MWGGVVLGVGSMVGAGVFALLGVAATMAGSAIWLSFLAAGIIALLTGHSFAQLGVRYPSRGGVVEYLVRAYGTGWFSGGCSILFYIAQLIGMAMISMAFGRFMTKLIGLEAHDMVRLIGLEAHELFWERALGSGLLLVLTGLALVGSKLIRKTQRIFVVLNLTILAGFALALLGHAEVPRLAVETWPAANDILGSLALTFFAFTGFAVISNAAEDMDNPARDLPRAMYTTIAIVTVLYVGLAMAVVAAVGEAELTSSGAMLLAVVAKSVFGEIGYTLLLITAIAATVTALNGGLFGVTSITFTLAEKGQLPSRFKKEIRASTRGLTISALLALLMINFLTLTKVASLGSATSLLVYSLVNFGALRLVKEKGIHRVLIMLSVVACVTAILVWIFYTVKTSPDSLVIFLSFLIIAFIAEGILQRFRGRRILAQTDSEGTR